jgi:hypothetical protein
MKSLHYADWKNEGVVMKTIAKVLLAVSALVLVTGCARQGLPVPHGHVIEQSSTGEDSCRVETFVHGSENILYFSCTSREFTQALANYQEGHPNTRIVTMSNDSSGGYGWDVGYTVVTEPRAPQETAESWAPH